MQLSEIRTDVRSLTDETVETPVLRNTEIDTFINRRYMRVVSEIMSLNDEFFGAKNTTIDLVNGTDSYALPDLDDESKTRLERILQLKIAYSGTRYYTALPLQAREIPDNSLVNIVFQQTNPYYNLLGETLYIFPTPTANMTDGIRLWYVQRPTILSSDTDVPAFSTLYHGILAYGAAADVKRKEGDVQDLPLIRDFEDQFQEGLRALLTTIPRRDTSFPKVVGGTETNGLYSEFDLRGRTLS